MARLYKRGNVWYADIFISGKRGRKPLSTNKEIAKQKLSQMILDRAAAKYGHGAQDKPWEYCVDRYLAWSKENRNPTTHAHNKRALAICEDMFHPRVMLDLTPQKLEKVKSELRTRNLKDDSINRTIRAVKTAMRKIEASEELQTRRWELVEEIRVPRGRLVYFTHEELQRLLDACRKPHWVSIVLLGARAGLRAGEIYHLEWKDVDFTRDRINICAKGDWTPKGYERRHIPMTKDLQTHLERLSKRAESPYVVAEGSWRPSSSDSMGQVFKKILRKAKLTGFLHVLRHTFGSHLAMAGVPLVTIRDLMGHKSVATTEIYAHLSAENLAEGVKKLRPIKI